MQKNINSFFKIVHPTNDILKKGVKIEWRPKVNRSFEYIKVAIFIALVLVSPDYQLPFKVYYFSSENSCVGIFTQKKDGEYERLIRFMSFTLKNVELNYPNLENQSFTSVKVIKNFCHYILQKKVYAIVSNPRVKSLS